jgi:hypothetical protein
MNARNRILTVASYLTAALAAGGAALIVASHASLARPAADTMAQATLAESGDEGCQAEGTPTPRADKSARPHEVRRRGAAVWHRRPLQI